MKIRTNVKAGGITVNRCEPITRRPVALRIKTGVRAGGLTWGGNRCERPAAQAARR